MFFFFIAFINNSKIITGKQLWKHCTSLNIHSPFHLVCLSYEIVSWCYWGKWVRCALLRSWRVSSFLCRSDIIKGTVMKETGQLFLSMSHSSPLSAKGHANPALCSPQRVSINKWQEMRQPTSLHLHYFLKSVCGQVHWPANVCARICLHIILLNILNVSCVNIRPKS